MRWFRLLYLFIFAIGLLSFNLPALLAQDDARLKHWHLLSWAGNQAFVWDVEHNTVLFTLEHERTVLDAVLLADGRLLTLTSEDVLFWDSHTGSPVLTAHIPDPNVSIWEVIPLSGQRMLVTGFNSANRSRTLQLLDTSTGEWGDVIDRILNFQHLPDGRFFIDFEADVPQIWDADMRAPQFSFQAPADMIFSEIALLSDGRFISRQETELVHLWDGETGALVKTIDPTDAFSFLKASTTQGVIIGVYPHSFTFWNVETDTRGATIVTPIDGWLGEFLADGRFYMIYLNGSVRVWNVETGELLVTLSHDDYVLGLSELEDGRLLTYSGDGTARLWDGIHPQPLLVLRHPSAVTQADWFDDNLIMTTDEDNNVRLWDATTGSRLALFSHEEMLRGAVLIPA